MTMMCVTNSIICISSISLSNSFSSIHDYPVFHELDHWWESQFRSSAYQMHHSRTLQENIWLLCVSRTLSSVCVSRTQSSAYHVHLSQTLPEEFMTIMCVTNTIIGVCITNSIICISCVSLSNFTNITYDYDVCHENHHRCVCVVKGPHILII